MKKELVDVLLDEKEKEKNFETYVFVNGIILADAEKYKISSKTAAVVLIEIPKNTRLKYLYLSQAAKSEARHFGWHGIGVTDSSVDLHLIIKLNLSLMKRPSNVKEKKNNRRWVTESNNSI